MNISEKNSNSILIFFAVLIFISIGPIFNSLPIKLLFLIVLMFTYIIGFRKIKFARKFISIYILLLLHTITSLFSCYEFRTIIPFVYALTFSITVFSAIQLSDFEIVRIVKILTNILLVTVILSWIGFFYSFVGSPLFSLINPNGVRNFFWLTTFSITESPIRPSGFYDEPGAFSFFICLLVFLRSYLGLSIKSSFILMIGGFVTQSTAHAIFFVVWIFSIIFTMDSKINLSILNKIFIIGLVVSFGFFVFQSNMFSWAIERSTKWYEDPESAERVKFFANSLDKIDESKRNLIYGFGYDCVNRNDCEGFSENLLTPIAMGGLMSSWPFYLFLLFTLIFPIISFSNFSLIGIGLLILQRPYFLELPYSFCLALIIGLFLNLNYKNTRISNN